MAIKNIILMRYNKKTATAQPTAPSFWEKIIKIFSRSAYVSGNISIQ